MIYAKDKQTELALEDDWHHNVYDRRYVALVSGEMEEDEGTVAIRSATCGCSVARLTQSYEYANLTALGRDSTILK